MAPIQPLRSLLTALAPANWRDTVNRHPKIANLIAVIVILMVVVDVGRQLGLPGSLLTARHSFAPRPKPLKFLNVRHLHCPAQFITAMVSDGHGGAYVASEDSGIYHYQAGSAWQHYDKANSPGLISNHIYSLCLDAKGRLWAGTLRHGVCVYNGAKWKHYGLLNGPLGCHVVAIVSDPYDKSVWMCTEAGISIYETGQHTWRYLPQATPDKSEDISANGLPPNPDCVAFNADGVAFVGTQCNGLAIGYPPYNSWWMVKGPWKMPITPFGKGLPSNLINAVVAGRHGRIYVATDEGLAWDNPGNPYVFQYERGADYAAKAKGLWHPPARFKTPSRAFLNHLLPGDHVTCLAVDKLGELWLGTWRNGMWINTLNHRVPRQGQIRELTPGVRRFSGALMARRRWWVRSIQLKKSGVHDITSIIGPQPPAPSISRFVLNMFYVSAILPLADGQVLIGHYGCGVTVGRLVPQTLLGRIADTAGRWVSDLDPGPFWHANLPQAAKAPTSRQLETLYENLLENNIPQKSDGPRVIPITDDWRTQGSWLGRYGRSWACLFACVPGPADYVWAPGGALGLDHKEGIGPHHRLRDNGHYHLPDGDAVRCWITWLSTARKRVLELPEVYLDSRVLMHLTTWNVDRRESEIDDHGETYPTTWEGPDLYVYLHIPPGAYTLSLYFYNKDGHSGTNRDRDYAVTMIPLPASYHFGTNLQPNTVPLAKMRGTAQCRVVNFWGGVWQRFLLRGPMKLAIRVAKNYSINAILQAAMLDPPSQHPAPYYYGRRAWRVHEKQTRKFRTKLVARWQSGQLPDDPPETAREGGVATAQQIIKVLDVLEHQDPAVWSANQRLAYLSVLRWCAAHHGAIPKDTEAARIAENCYYHLDLFYSWESAEKSRGITTSRAIEKGLRWNGGTMNYRGLEFAMIRRSIATHSAISAAEAADIPSPGEFGPLPPHSGSAAPLAARLVRILGVPPHGVSYLPVLARVCRYLARAVHPGVRRPIRTALGAAVPLLAKLVAAINRGAPPTLLRTKILSTITLSGYSIPEAGQAWEYGNVRERRGIAAFMALRGGKLLRSGNRAKAAQWEIASVVLAAQDDVALGTVGVLGRYLPATPGSSMYEPSALPPDVVQKLRSLCESRLSDDTSFYFRAYGLETLARKQLDREGSVPSFVRKAYLARLKAMVAAAAWGSLSRQYFFLRRVIAVQRVWGLGTHYRMATGTINALAGWTRALRATKVSLADRNALLRWIREVSLEPDKTGVLKDEARLEGSK